MVGLGAVAKVAFDQWQLHRYTAVAERERREQSLQRQLSQRKRHDETPFGVRALESRVEIEGVWVSRSNTPEGSSRRTSAAAASLRRSQDIDLEKQAQPALRQSRSRSGSRSTKAAGSSRDRAASAERISGLSLTSRDASPDAMVTKPARSRYPPCSYAKFSTHPYASRRPSIQISQGDLEAASLDAIRRASFSHEEGSSESDKTMESAYEEEPISCAAPALLTQSIPRPRQDSIDFDMMNNHRQSQAAETGQLTPRIRRSSKRDNDSTTSLQGMGQQPEYFNSNGMAVATSSAGSSPGNPFSTPKIDALPPAVRRSSMPDVTPFAQFCQTAPSSIRPASQLGPSATRRRSETAASSYASQPSTPTLQNLALNPGPATQLPAPALPMRAILRPEPTSKPTLPQQPKRPSFESVPKSEVIRGRGSGFEILKTGSLNPALPSEGTGERRRSAPPVSLRNAYRSRSSSTGSSSGRKLQKKRKPSIDSPASSDSGQ